ncbi:hypothetical protein ACIRPH_29980 [Nocardiopsis sp. NPDC101807]|uniref:hypothetical protein n=1 Tax=Nocardiopsis sp. NPDC101807 TaxID=3364339 RepID=UPI00382E8770
MADLILARGTAGATFAVDPAVPWVAAQFDRGALAPVEASSPGEQGVEQPPNRPAQAAPKAAWVAYVTEVSDLTAEDAEALTKAELVELAS